MKKIFTAVLFSCLTSLLWSQTEVFNIGDTPDYAGCDAIMHDDNGGLVPYSPDANDEILICSADITEQINLFFIGFSLSPGDTLYIYDGFDATAPLMGAYSGDSLLFETVSASGPCLTVRFVANGDAEVGDFSARIVCGIPCEFPIAVIQGQELNGAPADTVKICPGESVQFDASGSDWTDGASPTYFWDFGDGSTATTTGNVNSTSHTYPQSGGYRARLRLEDSNNCESLNLPQVIVFVSTPYVFDLTVSAPEFCLGEEVLLGTQAYIDTTSNLVDETENGSSITWIEENNVVFEDGIYIPDNQGCFEAEIVFNGFGGITIQDVNDFNNIYFNMEHSFVGDITIRIICPNGQTMSIFPEQGGSGTFLGEPIDDETGTPGIGYTYSFTPGATGGSWMEYLAGGGASPIPAGEYQPEGLFDDLVGCPIDGAWTLEVCDIVPADDGYVFEFGIQFVSTLYPDLLEFTPVVGNGCDSSYWVNPEVFTSLGENCDWAVFDPTAPGIYTFYYEVVNDFGCVFSRSIDANVIAPPFADAGEDVYNCGNAIELNGDYTYTGVSPVTFSWASSVGGLSGNTLNLQLTEAFLTEYSDTTTAIYFTTTRDSAFQCSYTDTLNLILPLLPLRIDSIPPLFPCIFELPYSVELSAAQNQAGVSYQWEFFGYDTLITDFSDETSISYSEPGVFRVYSIEPNCGRSVYRDIAVTPEPCGLIPNIVTPNGDGENDTFRVVGIERIPGSTCQIFNRWGNLVFEDKNYDGTWKATDIPDGVYYYVVGFNRKSGMEYFSGDLTILR
ncbi:MAG: hypothetical protein RL040_833 [Bacteroidota bacterium]